MHEIEVRSRSHPEGLFLRLSRGLLPLALCLLGGSAVAQSSPPRFLPEPRPLHDALDPSPQSATKGQKGKAKLQAVKRVGGEHQLNLGIKDVPGEIYNPSTQTYDKVHLRSYIDLNDQEEKLPNPHHKFIAPLIEMTRGETVRIALTNKLEPDGKECTNHKNEPNCFNSTNLHGHGLWVSPAGNSDNVLLEIKPGSKFEYEYNISEDHPAGTYWYHPHVHGSTAMQVGSGMAGALIIRGDRKPAVSPDGTILATGDIDTLLEQFAPKDVSNVKAVGGKPAPLDGNPHNYSEVLLFQQIPYACFDKDGNIRTEDAQGDNKGRWKCEEGETGEVRDFAKQLTRTTWAASGRYTTINGTTQTTIPLEAGRVYRWRLIDAGVREAIALRITQVKDESYKLPEKPTLKQEQEYIKENCKEGKVVNQFEVAVDGLTRGQIVKRDTNILEPGYRSDVLFALPSKGTYCLYDVPVDDTGSPSNEKEDAKLLGWVTAQGKGFSGDQDAFIKRQLEDAARKKFADDPAVLAKVLADLDDGLKTTAFVPHKSISEQELADSQKLKESDKKAPQEQKMTFNISGGEFQINGESFPGKVQPNRTLRLGTAEKWVLKATSVAGHPFHIHVNPFQVLQILDEDGKEINDNSDPVYLGMKGAWKDTIWIKKGYTVIIATRYERYIGDFVLHCHILDHEDKGMMQTIRIAPLDGAGNPVSFSLDGHGNHPHDPAAQTASSGSEVH